MELKTRGYEAVISAVRTKLRNPRVSPQTWLAEKLGVTRQAVHHWADNDGIPPKYVDKVKRLTGLTREQIRPQDIPLDLPDDVMEEITVQARARKETFTAHLIAVLRAGLRINK